MQTRNPKKKRKEKKRKAENVRAYYIYNTLLQERESILFGLAPPVFSLQPEGWLFDYYKLLFVSISIAKQTAEPNCRRAPYFQVCAKEEEDGGGGGGGGRWKQRETDGSRIEWMTGSLMRRSNCEGGGEREESDAVVVATSLLHNKTSGGQRGGGGGGGEDTGCARVIYAEL